MFAKSPELVEVCLDDAAEITPKPFLELLALPPEKDTELWARQLVALRIVERLDPDAVINLKAHLKKHPSPQVRAWLKERAMQAGQEVFISKPGGYELVNIPGGVFLMGSPWQEAGRYESESPLHEVQVPGFYMGRYPVTNEEYARFLKENPNVKEPAFWADRQFNQTKQPVVGVSWEDAQRYAAWAGLRLPSEAEWEYACRAGSKTRYYSGDTDEDFNRVGWYSVNSGSQLHTVGEKEPNGFGLYDMHGNVWEWVEDDWHNNYKGAPDDGQAWVDKSWLGMKQGSDRVMRGGGWSGGARGCRSAGRSDGAPGDRGRSVGFRLARSVNP
ncbi:MAG: hypothetical protein HW390_1452 [Candidatus Brocadiaceae bacterium]|nr:hypothetical protein [Candidatus Brocadiaceae bacterium]